MPRHRDRELPTEAAAGPQELLVVERVRVEPPLVAVGDAVLRIAHRDRRRHRFAHPLLADDAPAVPLPA